MYSTDLKEIYWQVINKILKLQEKNGNMMCMKYGMQVMENMLSFQPVLPRHWNGYTFKINFRGCTLRIEVGKNEIKITSANNIELNIRVYKVVYHINKGKELIIPRT